MTAGEHRLALPAGYQLGKYRLKEVLGAGGFGITYLADDSSLGRRVAIKELLPNDIATRLDGSTVVAKTKGEEENLAWARDRFVKEGRALAACDHPNVVSVYEMVEANGTAYMVTKFEEGRSLSAWLKETGGTPTETELRAILMPLHSGLEKVHRAGFLHRDLKPENIYLTDDGRPILLDFGSARQAVNDRTTSLTSIVTSGYAPFEQYHEDGKQGAWTDIYALGAVLYRALHGTKPPEATRRLKDDPCVRLAKEHAGKFSAPFLSAIDKALAVEPARRPQSVAEWRPMFGSAPVAEEKPAPPWWEPWLGQARRAAALAQARPQIAALAALAAVVLALGVWKISRPAPVPVPVPQPTPAPVVVVPAPPAPPPERVAAVATPVPAPVVIPPKNPVPPDAPRTGPATANEKKPGPRPGEKWTNSLGQIFAAVPGLPMHMAVWETRRGDFEAFVRATGYNATAGALSWTAKGWKAQGASWANPGFAQTPAHPVVGVSAYDASAFCRWLTEKERATGLLDQRLAYRLPTDDEWGHAFQDWKYVWGETWPPNVGAGNFAGEECKAAFGSGHYLPGYRDGYIGTSPVGTFQANAAGFYDLAGNASELCATWYRKELIPDDVRRRYPDMEKFDANTTRALVLRGGSWLTANPDFLLLSMRDFQLPQERYVTVGFRCVLAPVNAQTDLVLPPLAESGETTPAEVEPNAAVDRRLVATWEAKVTAPTGTATLRWEQDADGRYRGSVNGVVTDTGTLTASDGRIRRTSETTGVTAMVTYQFKTGTQLLTVDPLGPATWRRIKAPSAPHRDEEPKASDDDRGRDRQTDEPHPKPQPRPTPDIRREIQKRVPFRLPF